MQANLSASLGHAADAPVGSVVAVSDELEAVVEFDELESVLVATVLGASLPPNTTKPTPTATTTAAARRTNASVRLRRFDGIATACGAAGSQLTGAAGGGGGGGGGGSAGSAVGGGGGGS